MTKIILVRHAETEGNFNGVWNGVTDAPLTERGQRQIEAVARHIAHLVQEQPIAHFYASPMGRTRKTAAAIGAAIGKEAIIHHELREFDLGDWEGRSMKELGEQEKLWEIWATDPHFAPPNGESPDGFSRRAVKIIGELAELHAGETVLAVTHGGIISCSVAYWIENQLSEWEKWEPHNCSITILERADTAWRLASFSDVGHLPPELIVEKP
ncbi:MAG: histidine phosphatase family protein [Caldilineaceae bacterium]|nr:histidine phosphatase family protein [Caldilineaceae bacterium]